MDVWMEPKSSCYFVFFFFYWKYFQMDEFDLFFLTKTNPFSGFPFIVSLSHYKKIKPPKLDNIVFISSFETVII